jgi:thiamine biosynthesis lipoprotein
MRAVLVPLEIDPSPSPPPSGSRPVALSGVAMGSSWSARLMLAAGLHIGLQAALQAELDAIVAQMSHWDESSLLARYNRAPAGSWHALPPQFFAVIDYALSVCEASAGAYDPAAGALVNSWGFGPAGRYDQAGFYAPAPDAIAAVMAVRRHAQPVLDRAGRRLLQPGGAVLDLSAVAKGYAVDCMAECLQRHGIHHYLVEAGGELRGAGMKADGQPWWVEIEGVPDADLDSGSGEPPLLALHGLAVATSGDYRRYFSQAGQRRSHTLDPRSGQPIANGVASVTVVAATCMAADALSTALTVLGPEAGLAHAERHGIAARFLLRGNRAAGAITELRSSAWRALLQ